MQYDAGQTKVQRTTNGSKTRTPPKTRVAGLKLTPDQYRMIEQRAERRKVSMSAWMRSILLQAATSRPSSNGGFLRIREPDGEMI
jgi:hypothetical protein